MPVPDLLQRIRRALSDTAPAPAPPPPAPSGAAVGRDLAAAFERALSQASGRLVRAAEAEAEAALDALVAGRPVVRAEDEPSEDALEAALVGVDRADLLIAETGTVVRTYSSRAAARTSLLPPTTVFLARETDLVRDLPAALPRLAGRHRAGRATTLLVTGPSRTADIEKQLVIPAHGPREVIVLLLSAPP